MRGARKGRDASFTFAEIAGNCMRKQPAILLATGRFSG
jgi:hypothetical protein